MTLTSTPREEAAAALRTRVRGDVRFDPYTRVLYSTDASIYEIDPVGVVLPRDAEDVHATITACANLGVSVLARGGGTSLAGQATGHSVHIDFAKYCNRVLEVNPEARTVKVQPGVVLDQLNAHLAVHGLMFGPDVAPSNRATLGGMIGNNSCGTRSIVYGKTVDHVISLDVILADGQRVTLSNHSTNVPQTIVDEIHRVQTEEGDEIRARFPKLMRRVSGYNLDAVLQANPNLAHLIVGSEGTLAVIEAATLNLVPRPKNTGLLLIHCRDLDEALHANLIAIARQPSASELLERMLLDMARRSVEYGRHLWFLGSDEPHEIIVVECSGDSEAHVTAQIDAIEADLRKRRIGVRYSRALDPQKKTDVWKIRKAGLPLLMALPGERKPVAFVEDTAVAPEQLPEFIKRFQQIVAEHDTIAAFYAHTSVGCMHIRPLLDLKNPREIKAMHDMSEAVFALVCEFGGCMSGEHGDGLSRSIFNERQFGPRLYQAFRRLKRAFDPRGLMNPGKIVDAQEITENLRYGEKYPARTLETNLDFDHLGGFAYAIEQCNGSGVCRKSDSGTMCPSYMVTLDERHSTRGRANALRGVLSGRLPREALADEHMHEVMDLCVECKACKSECPSRVDMAALKFEFLTHWYEKHRVPLRSRLFAEAALLGTVGTLLPAVTNYVAQSRPVKWLLDRFVGIDRRRTLPAYTRKRFSAEVRQFSPELMLLDASVRTGELATHADPTPLPEGPAATAILMPDTFVEYHAPQVGLAALRVMQATGRRVLVSSPACCGRPMISMGLQQPASEQARIVSEAINLLGRRGCDVIMCEPSCVTAIREDYRLLMPSDMLGRVASHVFMFDEWLVRLADAGLLPENLFQPMPVKVLLHGHCQQKALIGIEPTIKALKLIPEIDIEVVDSGCCGMAGAFGYEKEHYDVSMAMGERRLLPAVRNFKGTYVVAPGTSCRQQIKHGARVHALHPAQLLARALKP